MKSFCKYGSLVLLNAAFVTGFASVTTPMLTPSSGMMASSSSNTMQHMVPVDMMMATVDSSAVASTLTLAETQAWVQPLASFLDPFLNFFCFAMLARVVLSWYPETKVTEMPWVLLVIPTQPLLRAVKGVIPPAFGVDISPIAWLALFSFIHEILLGQQGLLTMKIKYGI